MQQIQQTVFTNLGAAFSLTSHVYLGLA